MIGIMREMQKYVPNVSKESTFKLGDHEFTTTHDTINPLLFGGDQLTVRNARSAQTASSSETSGLSRLEGLVPVFEDWHARVCLLTVSTQNAHFSLHAWSHIEYHVTLINYSGYLDQTVQ